MHRVIQAKAHKRVFVIFSLFCMCALLTILFPKGILIYSSQETNNIHYYGPPYKDGKDDGRSFTSEWTTDSSRWNTSSTKSGRALDHREQEIDDFQNVDMLLWKTAKANSSHRCMVDCLQGKAIRCFKSSFNQVQFASNLSSLPSRKAENSLERSQAFTTIFQKRIWGGNPNDTEHLFASGGGSALFTTRFIRQILDVVLDRIKQALRVSRVRMLDVPCGDMNWMAVFLADRSDIDYMGIDIVPDIIQHHKQIYKDHTHWKFAVVDAVTSPINDTFDLIFTRQMTQHLTTAGTMTFLRHISESGSRYLLATTYSDQEKNLNVDELYLKIFHKQNFELSPYSLEPLLCIANDMPDTFMGLWSLPLMQVPSCDSDNVKQYEEMYSCI